MHRLLELFLVKELQDEEDQLPAQRRHGSADPALRLQRSRPGRTPAFAADPLPNLRGKKTPTAPQKSRTKRAASSPKTLARRNPRDQTDGERELTGHADPSRRDLPRFRQRGRRSAAAGAYRSNPAARSHPLPRPCRPSSRVWPPPPPPSFSPWL